MHHSDDADLETLAVTCYLDESATDGYTPTAVVGGLLINKSHFLGLDGEWRSLLDEFGLPAIHMKDFGGHGRFGNLQPDVRSAIFTRIISIIRNHNICTLATTLDHAQSRSLISLTVRKAMSPYGMCFIACVLGNHQIAAAHNYQRLIAFIVDTGNPYATHIVEAHNALEMVQKDGNFLHLGSLTFGNDEQITALQAADVICWAVRRRSAGLRFTNGFEPLESILDDKGHNQAEFPEASMRALLQRLQEIAPDILKP
jgi:Protein of unknown function (DUF3800)